MGYFFEGRSLHLHYYAGFSYLSLFLRERMISDRHIRSCMHACRYRPIHIYTNVYFCIRGHAICILAHDARTYIETKQASKSRTQSFPPAAFSLGSFDAPPPLFPPPPLSVSVSRSVVMSDRLFATPHEATMYIQRLSYFHYFRL